MEPFSQEMYRLLDLKMHREAKPDAPYDLVHDGSVGLGGSPDVQGRLDPVDGATQPVARPGLGLALIVQPHMAVADVAEGLAHSC